MSYSRNSLRGVIKGAIWGITIGLIQGDTRSVDYSSRGFRRCPQRHLPAAFFQRVDTGSSGSSIHVPGPGSGLPGPPKVCKIMAFMAIIMGLGLVF